jgi:hypothetical protein
MKYNKLVHESERDNGEDDGEDAVPNRASVPAITRQAH